MITMVAMSSSVESSATIPDGWRTRPARRVEARCYHRSSRPLIRAIDLVAGLLDHPLRLIRLSLELVGWAEVAPGRQEQDESEGDEDADERV